MNLIDLLYLKETKNIQSYLNSCGFKEGKDNIFRLSKEDYYIRHFINEDGKACVYITENNRNNTVLRIGSYPFRLYGNDSFYFLMNNPEISSYATHFCYFEFNEQEDFIMFLRLLYRHDRELFRLNN